MFEAWTRLPELDLEHLPLLDGELDGLVVVGVGVEDGDGLPDTRVPPHRDGRYSYDTLVRLAPCDVGRDHGVSQDTLNTVSKVFSEDLEEDNVFLNVEPLINALIDWTTRIFLIRFILKVHVLNIMKIYIYIIFK